MADETIAHLCAHCGAAPTKHPRRRFCSRRCSYAAQTTSPEKRFWSYVTKTETCWLWNGNVRNGYGVLAIERRFRYTHRLAWQWTNGPIPDGLFVCHHCDVRLCVRPDHLFLGTNSDNMRDMESKGRGPDRTGSKNKGERNGKAKLTADDVRAIRAERAAGVKCADVGRHFNISTYTVIDIMRGRLWAHVT